MTIRELLNTGEERLKKAGVPEPRLDCEYLLAEALHMPRLNLILSKFEEVPKDQENQFEKWMKRRENREPLQYILENQVFYGLTFKVAPGVLIPRCDTETLCEKALEWIPQGQPFRVLDLCTGSGALAVTLQKFRPRAQVFASDLSPDALKIARENGEKLHAPVHFLEGNLFEPVQNLRFDLILSNPPYIPDEDKKTLEEEVLKEPAMALFGGPDGLYFYREITRQAPSFLSPQGALLFEIGDTQGEDVSRLMAGHFENIETFKDLSGRPRVVRGRLKKA